MFYYGRTLVVIGIYSQDKQIELSMDVKIKHFFLIVGFYFSFALYQPQFNSVLYLRSLLTSLPLTPPAQDVDRSRPPT